MLQKSVFEKFVKEMKEKFNDEYILILATDIDGEWKLEQVEEYGGLYGLTLGSHRVDRLDESFFTFVNNRIVEFEKPHNVIARKYNLPDEVIDLISNLVSQVEELDNELADAEERIVSLQSEIDCGWELKQMEYDDFDRGCYDDDFYYVDSYDED